VTSAVVEHYRDRLEYFRLDFAWSLSIAKSGGTGFEHSSDTLLAVLNDAFTGCSGRATELRARLPPAAVWRQPRRPPTRRRMPAVQTFTLRVRES
jgi:hypothetical protein